MKEKPRRNRKKEITKEDAASYISDRLDALARHLAANEIRIQALERRLGVEKL